MMRTDAAKSQSFHERGTKGMVAQRRAAGAGTGIGVKISARRDSAAESPGIGKPLATTRRSVPRFGPRGVNGSACACDL